MTKKREIIKGKMFCCSCKQWVKIEDFSTHKTRGFGSYCKKCVTAKVVEYNNKRQSTIVKRTDKEFEIFCKNYNAEHPWRLDRGEMAVSMFRMSRSS